MGTGPRLAIVAALLAAGGAAGLLATRGGDAPASAVGNAEFFPQTRAQPTASLPPECVDLPPRVEMPDWFPPDLPFPPESYPALELESEGGPERLILAVPLDLSGFVRFVLDEWPEAGWTLGRGESEPGEAEAFFQEGDRVGVFRANSVYCRAGWVQVLIAMAPRQASASPPAGQASPSPAAS